jgi:hydrogenase maturation protease
MTKNDGNGTTLVLGVGNPLMGDEGFGVHVVRRLKEVELPSRVRVEEGGVGGFNLLGSLEGVQRLLVVDVMMLDIPPGELRLLKPGPEMKEPGKRIISFHQVGVMELVAMWRLLGYEPEITFLVTRPEKIDWSTELSPPLQLAAQRATELIPRLCQESLEKGIEEPCSR